MDYEMTELIAQRDIEGRKWYENQNGEKVEPDLFKADADRLQHTLLVKCHYCGSDNIEKIKTDEEKYWFCRNCQKMVINRDITNGTQLYP